MDNSPGLQDELREQDVYKVRVRCALDSVDATICDAHGNELHGVQEVTTSIKVDDIPRATVRLIGVAQDIEALGTYEMQHPRTGEWCKIRYIIFDDGEWWPRRPEFDYTSIGDKAVTFRLGYGHGRDKP